MDLGQIPTVQGIPLLIRIFFLIFFNEFLSAILQRYFKLDTTLKKVAYFYELQCQNIVCVI